MFSPLEGVRVVDLTDRGGAYAGRLLADLGADVVRVVRGVEPLSLVGPHIMTQDGRAVSAFELFTGLNKRSVRIAADEVEPLHAIVATADVVIHMMTPGGLVACGLGEDVLARIAPGVIVASVLPFGTGGPRSGWVGEDLTQLAAGGLLYLGGYPDTEPIAVHGGQSDLGAAIVAATGIMLALIGRRRGFPALSVDVSAQEAIAGALEEAIAEYDLLGTVRRRRGDRAREAGTGTYRCGDGYIAMVAGRMGTAAGWAALTAWMVEAGAEGAEELATDAWRDFNHRQLPESIERFEEVFFGFAAGRSRASLYEEGQRRGIAIAPVNHVHELFDNPQLQARQFFVDVAGADPVGARFPGRPYRIDGETGFVRRPAPVAGQHTSEVFAELSGHFAVAAS
jgi:crotonobetainyl-CoA:carnitine CoA-transferase CaiB-like acyl-CoA transferase